MSQSPFSPDQPPVQSLVPPTVRAHQRWTLRAVALASVLALATVAFGLHSNTSRADSPPPAPAAVPVSVATVGSSQVHTWQDFSGRLEAVDRVELRSRVAGAIAAVHFREGALVHKGDLLVTIDPAPYAAEVDRAQAAVTAAQARVAYERGELARAQRLWEERAVAQRELDAHINAHREADANLLAAQAALQTARLNLGYTQVRAPISGRAGKLDITVGNLVAAGPGAPVLTTLVSVSPIYASFDVDENLVRRALAELPSPHHADDLQRIPVDMVLSENAAGDAAQTTTGRLQLVDNQVDPRSGTVRLRAVFDNADGDLLPGQFARVRMGQAQASAALLINERAVGTDQDKRFVLVVGADNKAAYREVQLGGVANGLRIVQNGLKAGERIVVKGLQRVHPGALVQPEPVAMDARSEAQASSTARPAS